MKFEQMGSRIGALTEEKNKAYGDAAGKSVDFLKLLFPNGVPVEKYGDMLLLVRVFDKQMRIATAKDALGESPWMDIGGYGVLGAVKDEKERNKNERNSSKEVEEAGVESGSPIGALEDANCSTHSEGEEVSGPEKAV